MAMTNKWQKYIAIGVIALVLILIVTRVIANRVSWEEEDRAKLTSSCLDDLGGYAVRFPLLSEDYCSCTSDTLMKHFTKAEYLLINNEADEVQREKMLPVIAECYSIYQEGMFKANRLD
jgi:hypothetical protein